MSDTVLVKDLATGSRIRIATETYERYTAKAKEAEKQCRYVAEKDQGCEGMTGKALEQAQIARKPIREKKEALLAEAAAL